MNHERHRCQAVRWLLKADPSTDKELALNFILFDVDVKMNRSILLENYIKKIEELLFQVIPDTDCVYIIISKSELIDKFYKVFKY